MIRVLALVTYRIYPTLMGGQKGIALFYEVLQQHADVVLALSKNNAVPPDTTRQKKLLYTNRLLPLNLLCIGILKKFATKRNVQLIIAEHSYAGWLALLLKKQTGIPFLIHSHNLESHRFRQMHRWWWRLYEHYEKWIHQQADFNFFISDADKSYALEQFHLDAEKCATITYGVQSYVEKTSGEKISFLESLHIPERESILFFNGTLDYEPNFEAAYILANEVLPRLKQAGQLFKILISGNRASHKLKTFLNQQLHIIYVDYVPDVNLVYQSSQLFLNPILNNTGVKTKVLEAISNQCTVISTISGAAGICTDACGDKLVCVADGDWDLFSEKIILQLQKPFTPTPQCFFDAYLWSNIAQKAAAELTKVVAKK